jgi:hypothetical protein
MTITPPVLIARLRDYARQGADFNLTPANALALIDHVQALTLEVGRLAAHVERMKVRDDDAHRKLAEAHSIRVAADNVEANADKRARESWRLYQETRALLVAVLGIVDALEGGMGTAGGEQVRAADVLSDAQQTQLRAARAAMKVADLG